MTTELDGLALGCLLPSFGGTEVPDWIKRAVEEGLGGVVLFAANVPGLPGLTAELRGLLVAIDEEGGDVTRLEAREGSSYPGNLALGAVDDVSLTEEIAASIARDLAAVGVTMNLAPVADVNVDPLNAAIGVRSFGAESQLVAAHTAAFVRGTQREGIAACAKHFPGHGHTIEDSHRSLPTIELEESQLRSGPLQPFVAAINAGVAAIMTAHVRLPALDDAPATMSHRILNGLLRRELGFAGLIVTDALDMGAIAGTSGIEEGAIRALAAGADALCLGPAPGEHDVRAIQAAIVAAVRNGRLQEERLSEAVTRISATCALRARPSKLQTGPELGSDAARQALDVEGEPSLASRVTVLELRPEPLVAAGEHRHGLADALRHRGLEVQEVRAEQGDVLRAPGEAPLVLVLRDAHRHEWQRSAANELLARRPDAVVVETGVPTWRPPRFRAYVVTHGGGRVNLEAAAEALAPRTGERRPEWQVSRSSV